MQFALRQHARNSTLLMPYLSRMSGVELCRCSAGRSSTATAGVLHHFTRLGVALDVVHQALAGARSSHTLLLPLPHSTG